MRYFFGSLPKIKIRGARQDARNRHLFSWIASAQQINTNNIKSITHSNLTFLRSGSLSRIASVRGWGGSITFADTDFLFDLTIFFRRTRLSCAPLMFYCPIRNYINKNKGIQKRNPSSISESKGESDFVSAADKTHRRAWIVGIPLCLDAQYNRI